MNEKRRALIWLIGVGTLGAGALNIFNSRQLTGAVFAAEQPAPVWGSSIPNPLEDLEVIASGFDWSEGPVWVGDENGSLFFSDVPGNAIFRWDGQTTSAYLAPSGYAGFPMPAHIREGGSNGLAVGRGGLVVADSGNRCVSLIDTASRSRTLLADRYQGKRFNSPNDLVIANNGDVYFTDPPFGLTGVRDSELRELDFTGVFRIDANNRVHLVADNLNPNGIGLSPDNRTLYVTDADGWIAMDLNNEGMPVSQKILVPRATVDGRGDGMKVDLQGNIWTSGPGGIHVFSSLGQHTGFTPIDGRVSNCAFGPEGYLYITNDNNVLRGKIRASFAIR